MLHGNLGLERQGTLASSTFISQRLQCGHLSLNFEILGGIGRLHAIQRHGRGCVYLVVQIIWLVLTNSVGYSTNAQHVFAMRIKVILCFVCLPSLNIAYIL